MKVCPTCGTEYPDDSRFCPDDGTTLRSGGAELVGSVIADRYHITAKLGEGGMGAVYLGEHVRMGRKSAIKVINQSMAQDAEAIARFNREAANAARINHPNVCGIYDFGETPDGVIYLAMEFIEGVSLTDLLTREGALAAGRAADILGQSADALQAAHDLGIVHRDLKPDNIMIARTRDGTDLVKVVDFGIAKAMGGSDDQKVTKTGLVVGTPEYMSPEQLSGDQLDGRSDIYSLALVFFRMLTGSLPFQAASSQEVMIKRLTDDPLRLAEVLPDVAFPPSLQAALDRALQRMPADRYPSAAGFGRDVRAAVAGFDHPGPVVDTEGATQMFEPGATAALPETLVQDAAPTPTPSTPVPSPSSIPARARSGNRRRLPIVAGLAVTAVAAGTIGVLTTRSRPSGSESPGVIRDTADPVTSADNGHPGTDPSPPSPTPGGEDARGDTSGGPAGRNTPTDPPDSSTTNGRSDTPLETITPAGIPVVAEGAAERILDLSLSVEDVDAPEVLRAVRDTVAAYYAAAGMSDRVRADAAFVYAQITTQLGDRPAALRWARRALTMFPDDRAYTTLVAELEGRSP